MVLIAEDDPALRASLERLLSEQFEVLVACDGYEAISAIDLRLPDLVITDYSMPNGDGISLVTRIRRSPRTSTIPVIMLSAHGDSIWRTQAYEAGVNICLAKPFNVSELLAAIRSNLRFSAYFHENDHVRSRIAESEERFQLATEAADLGTWDLDIATGESIASRKHLQIFGYKDSASWSKLEFYRHVFPADRHIFDEGFTNALRTGSLLYEIRIRRKDGELRWIRVNGRVLYNHIQEPVRILGIVMDITEQKTALDELEESESRFRSIADAAPVMIWITGTDKRCTFFNKRWIEFTGIPMENQLGYEWLMNVHPEDYDMVVRRLSQAFDMRENFSLECRMLRRDGHYRWISCSGVPYYSSGESFIGYIGTCTDVHERKTLRDELRKLVDVQTSELQRKNEELSDEKAFSDHIFESTVDIIGVYDKEMRLVRLNRKAEETYGWKREDVLGKTFLEIFPQGEHTQAHSDLLRAIAGEYINNKEYFSRIDRVYENFLIPLKHGDEVYAVLVIAHDNTDVFTARESLLSINHMLAEKNAELRKQNNFVQALLDASVDVIAVFDKEMRYLTFNHKMQAVYGLTKADIGKKVSEIFPDCDSNEVWLAGQKAFAGEPVHLKAFHSAARDFEAFYIPLLQDGEVYAVMFIGHDLSEIADAQRKLTMANVALEQKNRQLKQTNNALEQFAYIASHDLQEPLRKIQVFSELLSKTIQNESHRKNLTKINGAARHMSGLVRAVLTYTRISQANEQPQLVDLNKVLDNAIADYTRIIVSKKAEIIHDPFPVIPGLPFQLHLLFTNLLSNSLRFSKENPVIKITCKVLTPDEVDERNLDATRIYLRILFEDNGIGFEQAYAEHIFLIFQRLHSPRHYSGTGLGLALCRKIVENHYGTIKAEGRPGEGATFEVCLPMQ